MGIAFGETWKALGCKSFILFTKSFGLWQRVCTQLSCLISVNVSIRRLKWVQSYMLTQTHQRNVRPVQSHGHGRGGVGGGGGLSDYLETDFTLRIREGRERGREGGRGE